MPISTQHLNPLDVVAALDKHGPMTLDQLAATLRADRTATEQALVEALRKVWAVTQSWGYSPGTMLPYNHPTGEGREALRQARGRAT